MSVFPRSPSSKDLSVDTLITNPQSPVHIRMLKLLLESLKATADTWGRSMLVNDLERFIGIFIQCRIIIIQ